MVTIESRIAALKTALAEKYSEEIMWVPPNWSTEDMKQSEEHAFLQGASALAEVYRLEGKLEVLSWVEDHLDDLGLEQSKMLWRKQEEAQAQLEAFLASLEAK